MKKLVIVPVALLALTLASFIPAAVEPIKPGDSLPNADLKMLDVSNKMVSLKEATKEKGLLVMFSCNTCPYVVKNQARTRDIINIAAGLKIGVAVLNSNEDKRNDDDSFQQMQEYAKNNGYAGAYYMVDANSQQADAFGANRTPECFLFDKTGKLVYHGAIDDNPSDESAVSRKHLALAMDELAKQQPVTVATSRSVGCSIKRKQ